MTITYICLLCSILGKQKDFFTRTWGESFTETIEAPPSTHLGANYGAVSSRAFEKYLRKLNKYCPRHTQSYHNIGKSQAVQETTNNNSIDKNDNEYCTASTTLPSKDDYAIHTETSQSLTLSPKLSFASKSIDVPRIFLDPNFSPSNPETFSQLFPFFTQQSFQNHSNPGRINATNKEPRNDNQASTSATIFDANKIDSQRRLVQEKLHHYLDSVEEDIAAQVAQKSHHFFQVMTYHDALMSELTSLIKHVVQLRKRLQHVDKNTFRVVFKICQLKRRRDTLYKIAEKMELMSSLHKTQPSIQLFLTEKHFSGALDLITTSRDILCDDLRGISSFRHLSSQLVEIQSFIGKMLLGDFKQYITDEIQRQLVQERASVIASHSWQDLEKESSDQLTSVIYGLLRQNSYTFLEVLQEASFLAVKNLLKVVVSERLTTSNKSGIDTVTGLAKEYAEKASSEEWTGFLDVMLGSLMLLLRRIFAIHTVIVRAIASANRNSDLANSMNPDGKKSAIACEPGHEMGLSIEYESAEDFSNENVVTPETATSPVGNGQTIEIPQDQLHSLKVTSQEVLVNVSDQVVERISKILSLRSKEPARKIISTKELFDLSNFADILNEDVLKMTGKISSGFQISLQAQSVIYLESFHELKKSELSSILEKENWKKISQSVQASNSTQRLVTENEDHFLKVPILHASMFSKKTNTVSNTDLINENNVMNKTGQNMPLETPNNTDNVNSNGSGDMTDVTEDNFKDRHSSELPCDIDSSISNSSGNNLVNGNHPNNEDENELATSVESESDSDNATIINKPLAKEDQLVITQTKNILTEQKYSEKTNDLGIIYIKSIPFCASASSHTFLFMVCEYCILCATLPSIVSELGLKLAELVKVYNSKICQLVLGAGAISVSGLKTITIRNMALAKRSLEVIVKVVPDVKEHFESVHRNKIRAKSTISELKNASSTQSMDACFRQLDLAVKHLSNHADELQEKMLTVAEFHLQQQLSKWNPPTNSAATEYTVPSANFKALCKQVTKLYESVVDIWCHDAVYNLVLNVHKRFIASVKLEVQSRKLLPANDKISSSAKLMNEAAKNAATIKLLISEITFYASWVLQLNVLPPEILEQAKLVEQIF